MYLMFVFEREREREQERGGGDTDFQVVPASTVSAQSPMQGSNSRTARSWPEPKSDA